MQGLSCHQARQVTRTCSSAIFPIYSRIGNQSRHETATAEKYKAEVFLVHVGNFFLHCVGFQRAHCLWLYASPSTWKRSNLQSLFLPKCIFLVGKVKFNESIRSWSAHCFQSFFPLYKRANSLLSSKLILPDQNSSLWWPKESSRWWEFQRVYDR